MEDKQKRVIKVLKNMTALVKEDEHYADMFSEYLELMLDDLHSKDAFGTEGQSDPRGDGREGEWSIYYVEGVDE